MIYQVGRSQFPVVSFDRLGTKDIQGRIQRVGLYLRHIRRMERSMTTRISPEHDTRELTTDDVLDGGPPQILTHAPAARREQCPLLRTS